jgi:hypothetical protein
LRLNVSISRDEKLFHIGNIRPEDKAIYITKCSRLTAEEAKQAISTVMSKEGRCITFADGLIIVADKIELIGKIASMLEDIKSVKSDTWVLQFQILNYQHNDLKEIGLDTNANFGMAIS